MSKLTNLIRDIDRQVKNEGHLYGSVWAKLREKYASKAPRPIPAKRAKQRKNHETKAEHADVIQQLFERANGACEGARIRRNGEIVREHAPDCPKAVPFHRGDPAHDKSRGSGGEWALENLRWTSRQCHAWEHNGGKVVPKKTVPTRRANESL
jgi:hypothetical protein